MAKYHLPYIRRLRYACAIEGKLYGIAGLLSRNSNFGKDSNSLSINQIFV
jgi:hypothetical protein